MKVAAAQVGRVSRPAPDLQVRLPVRCMGEAVSYTHLYKDASDAVFKALVE